MRECSRDAAAGLTQGNVTVFYGGMATESDRTTTIVQALIGNGEGVRLIDKTQASKLQLSHEFIYAVGRLGGLSVDEMEDQKFTSPKKAELKNWLYDPIEGWRLLPCPDLEFPALIGVHNRRAVSPTITRRRPPSIHLNIP